MGNVGKKTEAENLANMGIEHFGAIDVLVNNAAIRPHAAFLETSEADWQKVIDVDLNAAIWPDCGVEVNIDYLLPVCFTRL